MKISPISSQGATVGAVNGETGGMVQRVRAMQMKTNATPGAADSSLSIQDPTEQTLEAEATKPLSPQFAALARERRAIQQERQALEAEKAKLKDPATQADVIDKARLKSDPLGTLLDAGVTYDLLTEQILANRNGVNPDIQALKAEIKALKEGVDKTFTDRDTQQEQQVLAEMRREALQIAAQGDDFELVRETKSIPQVMTLIERTYKETGEVLDVREAMKLVEDELIKDSLKLAGLKKVQGRLAPPPAPPPPQQHRQMRTLTNRDTASVPMSRQARALAAFNGTLKR